MGTGNHYKLQTVRLSPHAHPLLQVPCLLHPRIAKAHAYRYPRRRPPGPHIQLHLECQRMNKHGRVNRHKIPNVTRYPLSKFLTPSDVLPSPTLIHPVRLITPQPTKVTLSLRVRRPWHQHSYLKVWRSRCPLQRRHRPPSSWTSRCSSPCQL